MHSDHLSAELFWSRIPFYQGVPAPTVLKLQLARKIVVDAEKMSSLEKPLSHPVFKHFVLWNQFVGLHIETLHQFLRMPELTKMPNGDSLQLFLNLFTKTLHQSFFPLRIKTVEERLIHQKILLIVERINQRLKALDIGFLDDAYEHGAHVLDYMFADPSLNRSDWDIWVTFILKEGCYEIFKHIVDESILSVIEKKSPFMHENSRFSYENREKSSCQWKMILCDKAVDLTFHRDSIYTSLEKRVFACSMLNLRLDTNTMFNPLATFNLLHLLRPCTYQNGSVIRLSMLELLPLIDDPKQISYILKTMAKIHEPFNLKHFYDPNLREFLRRALIKIMHPPKSLEGSPMVGMSANALTQLFGKKSLVLAGFHLIVITHDLAFIFGLNNTRDFDFLRWVYSVLHEMEKGQAGATKIEKKWISSVEYVALMLSHFLAVVVKNWEEEQVPRRMQLRTLASKCLAEPFAMEATALAESIFCTLWSKNEVRKVTLAPPTPRILRYFNLNEFYLGATQPLHSVEASRGAHYASYGRHPMFATRVPRGKLPKFETQVEVDEGRSLERKIGMG